MRVLTLVSNLAIGGTQRAAVNYAVAYAESGFDSEVLAFGRSGPRSVQLVESGINLWVGEKGQEDSLQRSFDVLHVHGEAFFSEKEISFLRKFREANPSSLIIETNVFSRPDYSDASSYIDIHLHLSSWGLAKWQRWTSNKRNRPIGFVLPYLVNTETLCSNILSSQSDCREKLSIPENAFVALRIGQPILSKWSCHAFQAFEMYARSNPSAFFLCVGVPPKLSYWIERTNTKLGREVIRNLEPRFDDSFLSCVYGAADVFLHTSEIGESFGMVLAEAGLAELPCITLSTPLKDNGQTEVVRHGVTGLVTKGIDGLVTALRTLEDVDIRTQYGNSGRRHILESYSKAPIVKKLSELFNVGVGIMDRDKRLDTLKSNGFDEHLDLNAMYSSTDNYLGTKNSLFGAVKLRLVHNPAIYEWYRRIRSWTSK